MWNEIFVLYYLKPQPPSFKLLLKSCLKLLQKVLDCFCLSRLIFGRHFKSAVENFLRIIGNCWQESWFPDFFSWKRFLPKMAQQGEISYNFSSEWINWFEEKRTHYDTAVLFELKQLTTFQCNDEWTFWY